jgi:uncharacterized membrane protein YoaK (UPF0700 family)
MGSFVLWMTDVPVRASKGIFCKDDQITQAVYYSLPMTFFISIAMAVTSMDRGAQRKKRLFTYAILAILCIGLVVVARTTIC